MTMRYSIIRILSLAVVALPIASASAANKAAEDGIWVCAGYFEKQIDQAVASYGIRNYRERFLATRKGAARRGIFVFPVAYRIMSDHLRSQAAARFGEASYTEFEEFDLRNDVAMAPGDAAKEPSGLALKPGDQVASLPDEGVRLVSTAAVRITTKPYNGVPSRKGWSELTMVVLDGARILGLDSTLVVVWRHDSAEEWGIGKSGSLFDFGRHRTGDTFVTSTEFALMERLKALYNTPFTFFPLAASGPLSTDAARLDMARAWLRKYKEDPASQELQANRPGGC